MRLFRKIDRERAFDFPQVRKPDERVKLVGVGRLVGRWFADEFEPNSKIRCRRLHDRPDRLQKLIA